MQGAEGNLRHSDGNISLFPFWSVYKDVSAPRYYFPTHSNIYAFPLEPPDKRILSVCKHNIDFYIYSFFIYSLFHVILSLLRHFVSLFPFSLHYHSLHVFFSYNFSSCLCICFFIYIIFFLCFFVTHPRHE